MMDFHQGTNKLRMNAGYMYGTVSYELSVPYINDVYGYIILIYNTNNIYIKYTYVIVLALAKPKQLSRWKSNLEIVSTFPYLYSHSVVNDVQIKLTRAIFFI